MSLISDSLKKAQRMRGDPGGQATAVGGQSGGRGRGSSGLPWWLLVTGAISLVAIAVALTAILLQSKSPVPLASASPVPVVASSATSKSTVDAGVPTIVAPVITITKPTIEPTPIAAIAAPEVAKAQKKVDAKPSADVVTFIDALRVAGVRSSGDGSKVLMNDHVYKVNDIVDRMLNVRLIEVKTDGLTFEDGNGVQYTKNF